MSAARKDQDVVVTEIHRSGEHTIELDRLIRNTFEEAFETDLQTTSRVSKFELEEVLSSPEVRPTDPPPTPPIVGVPIVNVVPDDYEAIAVGSIPPPAIEIGPTQETKEEERDP
jgi:hypothetical protein